MARAVLLLLYFRLRSGCTSGSDQAGLHARCRRKHSGVKGVKVSSRLFQLRFCYLSAASLTACFTSGDIFTFSSPFVVFGRCFWPGSERLGAAVEGHLSPRSLHHITGLITRLFRLINE
ncbi:hypothetical protein WMY93_024422 [Mugilogobius chulae]|uniref:Secreted protein n=1 Tax=Mugilogobius chulae TaxID=88201 RepID=A0AAW0N9L1_9GOBI